MESAVAARDALLQHEVEAQGFAGARVGFAKIPPLGSTSTSNNASKMSANLPDSFLENMIESNGSSSTSLANNSTHQPDLPSLLFDAANSWQNDLSDIMIQFNVPEVTAREFVKGKYFSFNY